MDAFLESMNEKWTDIKIQMNESGKQKKENMHLVTKRSWFNSCFHSSYLGLQNSFKSHSFTDIMKVITQTLQSYDYNYMWDTVYIYTYIYMLAHMAYTHIHTHTHTHLYVYKICLIEGKQYTIMHSCFNVIKIKLSRLKICRVYDEKCWAGRSTSWNQDFWEKYQ